MGQLEGKVAVVTGGGSGIGQATAEMFISEGAKVVVADISGAQDAVAEAIGDRATAVQADVSHSDGAAAIVRAAVERFGGLDVLFNNAGIDGPMAPIESYPVEDFDRVIAVNLRGVFLGIQAAVPAMKECGGGVIINTASVAGLVGVPTVSGYCASKGGVVQLTRTAAVELAAHGIRVNAICPGMIDTPMLDRLLERNPDATAGLEAFTPLGRPGSPIEIARMAAFLASDSSSYLTGVALPVDGGFTAW
jgi:NAD(P)-dependent dehydrogenase (short-subunit alcohol dehydrogenase family)